MKYHVTGVFLLTDLAQTTTDIFTSVLAADVGLDAAVVVTNTAEESAVLDNLGKLLDEAGVDHRYVVRDETTPLAAQLSDVMTESQEAARVANAQSWLWFLTEHTIVSSQSLARQLQAVEISPSVAIAGAKQLCDRALINVGLSVAHNGEVVSLIEPGELDQGQYDHRTDVFAVSLSGMLLKTELFDQLGGFDQYTPAAAQTVDLCWRARLAGHRVAVVPAAEVAHPAMPEDPTTVDIWETSRWLRLKHTGLAGLLGGWAWSLLSVLGVVLTGLILKDPRTGMAQARGILRTMKRPGDLLAARKTAKVTRTRPFDAVADLRPSRHRVRDFKRSVLETAESDRVIGDGTGVTATAPQATGGHDDFDELATPERNWVGIGAVTLGLLFGTVALLGLRHLVGVPALAGGNLLPVSDQLAALVAKAASGWVHAGVGAPGYDGPFGWLLVLLGLTGNASAALVWIWVLALPLAGLGAWALAGTITASRYVRFAAGLSWAAAPVLFIALSEGRLGGLLTHLVLPWFALAVLRAIGYPAMVQRAIALELEHFDDEPPVSLGRKSRTLPAPMSITAAAWTAILLTVITAAAPMMFIPLTISLVLLMLVFRANVKVLWWTPLLALSSLLPAIVTHRTDLRAIFADPGAPAGFDPAPTWQLLLGLPHRTALDAGLAELPWLNSLSPELPWVGIVVGLIAAPVIMLAIIGAVVPGPGGTLARAGVMTAFIGLAVGTFNAGFIFAIDQTGTPVPLSTVPAVSLSWLGLVIAAVNGLNAMTRPRSSRRPAAAPQRAGWVARTATSVLVVVGIVSTGLWLTPRIVPGETLAQALESAREQRTIAATEAQTDQDPTDGTQAQLTMLTGQPSVMGVLQRSLPATAVDAAQSELRARTLVITRTSEGLRTHLISGQGTMLDDMTGTWTARTVTGSLFAPDTASADDADNALRTVAAQLTSGADTDPRPTLDALGAGYVVLTDPSGTETTLAASIDAAPGMAPVGHTQAGWLWRVVPDEGTDQEATQIGVEVLTQDGGTAPRGTATARARIVEDGQTVAIAASDPDGTITVELPTAMAERQLVLAERAHPGFRAWLDGAELDATAVSPEWVQAFELPKSGGQLVVEYAPPAGKWLWFIPGIIGLVMLALGIPTPTRQTTGRVDVTR